MQQTLHLNNAGACIKQASHWGYDKFYNVCNGVGDWITVEWGAYNWTVNMLSAVFFVSVIGAASYFAWVAYRVDRELDKVVS